MGDILEVWSMMVDSEFGCYCPSIITVPTLPTDFKFAFPQLQGQWMLMYFNVTTIICGIALTITVLLCVLLYFYAKTLPFIRFMS